MQKPQRWKEAIMEDQLISLIAELEHVNRASFEELDCIVDLESNKDKLDWVLNLITELSYTEHS